ncbi:MAG: hypothetical protein LBK56_10990, partial [Gracilibacteraceae bacterium]|nr:hypothetical protein [Gracilibacteraceae bacterium]
PLTERFSIRAIVATTFPRRVYAYNIAYTGYNVKTFPKKSCDYVADEEKRLWPGVSEPFLLIFLKLPLRALSFKWRLEF